MAETSRAVTGEPARTAAFQLSTQPLSNASCVPGGSRVVRAVFGLYPATFPPGDWPRTWAASASAPVNPSADRTPGARLYRKNPSLPSAASTSPHDAAVEAASPADRGGGVASVW